MESDFYPSRIKKKDFRCKKCSNELLKNWLIFNKEKVIESQRKYRESHREYFAQRQRGLYEKNKIRMRERAKLWYLNNKEKYLETQLKYHNSKKGIETAHKYFTSEKRIESYKKYLENRRNKSLERKCKVCFKPVLKASVRLCLDCFEQKRLLATKYNHKNHSFHSRKWQEKNKVKNQLEHKTRYAEKLGLVKTILSCSCDYPKKQNHHFNNNWREVWKVCPRCHKWVDSFDYGYITNPEIEVSNVRLD